ncbi:MAG: hypothetical protein RI957_1041 [Verrucomicrobiota bacterium]
MAIASAPAARRMLMIGRAIIVDWVWDWTAKGSEQLVPSFPDGYGHALVSKHATSSEEAKDGENRGEGVRFGILFVTRLDSRHLCGRNLTRYHGLRGRSKLHRGGGQRYRLRRQRSGNERLGGRRSQTRHRTSGFERNRRRPRGSTGVEFDRGSWSGTRGTRSRLEWNRGCRGGSSAGCRGDRNGRSGNGSRGWLGHADRGSRRLDSNWRSHRSRGSHRCRRRSRSDASGRSSRRITGFQGHAHGFLFQWNAGGLLGWCVRIVTHGFMVCADKENQNRP